MDTGLLFPFRWYCAVYAAKGRIPNGPKVMFCLDMLLSVLSKYMAWLLTGVKTYGDRQRSQ